MAVIYIPVNRITTGGNTNIMASDLVQVVNTFRSAQSKLSEIKDIMDNMVAIPDYSSLVTEFGLQSTDGTATYNLIAGAVSELAADTNFNGMVDRIIPKET